MSETINLADKIKEQLPPEMVDFMRRAGEIASGKGQNLYLVGGVVRDLLLGRNNLDLDLVLEGDAISLAEQMAGITGGRLTAHKHFGTATIKWDGGSADLTTARSESYSRPGALPAVRPDFIENDLFRRDFTINAMAVALSPGDYGRLIDPYRGRDDLERGLLRILHRRSFIDDSTRIWRGLRYEQRLNFSLEADTLRQLKRNSPMLETISGDRLRHELELVLREEVPEKVLRRADELQVLPGLHPSLKAGDWLAEKFAEARRGKSASLSVYMALLAYRLDRPALEQFILHLNIGKSLSKILRDSHALQTAMESLADPALAPSRVYKLLRDYAPTALVVTSIAAASTAPREHIRTFLARLCHVKPALTGNDLLAMGIPSDPRIKEVLERLLDARLDGKVTSKEGEEELVRELGITGNG